MVPTFVRPALAAVTALTVLVLTQAEVRSAVPGASERPTALSASAANGAAVPGLALISPLAKPALIEELAAQGLKSLGLASEDAARLAARSLPLARTEDAAQAMDDLARDAAGLGALDEASARDVFARVHALINSPLVTTDSVGRAFGVDSTGSERQVMGGLAMPGSTVSAPDEDPDAHLGGTCLACPAFDFGPFTPTTVWQSHASSLIGGPDCNWYRFDVEAGATYEFTTCAPGSADFDTVLELFSSACGFLDSDDDSCGAQSFIQWTSGVTGDVRLKVRGFGGAPGNYDLAYRRVCIGEPDCDSPDGFLAAPTTACQYQGGTVSSCSGNRYYHVDLERGLTYTFSLCSSTCPAASAGFNSALDLYDGATLVATANSVCGDDAEISYTTDPLTGDGTYCVIVRRENGAASDFNLGYRVACSAPSNVRITPDSASTAETDCTRNQEFTVLVDGTGAFDWSWTITPLEGQTANPASGTATTAGNQIQFTSLLTGDGDYQVSVDVTNECGSDGHVITYNLEDRAGPVLTPTAEQVSCGSSVMASAAPVPVIDRLAALDGDDLAAILGEPDPAVVQQAIADKIGVEVKSVRILDSRTPGVTAPPGTMAVSCGAPCTGFSTLSASNPYYDVFLNCDDGSYTARTGVAHSVTVSSGSPQNVIFGGAGGSPGTSDASWFVHNTLDHYINPNGGQACLFDPPDTSSEPDNVGIEAEWTRNPTGLPGVTLTLREEIVAFGDSEANSGVRLTLGARNEPTSTSDVVMGVRWQIDYQNAFDDGPLFAGVICSPFEVFGESFIEHEYSDAEIGAIDFYRIQNNTSTPIFGNFTNTTEIAGFPDTFKPDRLTYAQWGSVVSTGWDYTANEGNPSPDFDSAVLYWFGFDAVDGISIAPGEAFLRSVIIFTAGDDQDCGERQPGECATEAVLEICPGECARVGATATDGCSTAIVELIGTSPGAPPCVGNPCTMEFPDEGDFVYTWRAVDEAGNEVECTSTVVVREGPDCNQPPSCFAGTPATSECREAPIDGSFVDDPDGDEISYTWTSDNPMVSVDPPAGVIGAGLGPRALPPTVARLDSSQDPCGVTATLTLIIDDGQGATSSCTTTVLFQDTTPPTVTATSGSGGGPDVCLWPPNHWYVPVTTAELGAIVTDSCTAVTLTIVGCVSDQPEDAPERPDVDFWNGDGHTVNDCIVSPDGQSVLVRSERCGGGLTAQDGRHYGIAFVATDACGNASAPTIAGTIHVPHDQAPAEDGCLNPTEVGFSD